MDQLEALLYLTSVYPVARAWLANRSTTIVHALSWTAAAWLAWFGTLLMTDEEGATSRYLALCLTGCAGIAVLGARRPIVGAWNWVLLCLLGVLLLPLAENAVLGTPLLDPLRLMFVLATVTVGTLNYLPTRFGIPALLVGIAGGIQLLVLSGGLVDPKWYGLVTHLSYWLLPLACWLALLTGRQRGDMAAFDRLWLEFRDRFGLLWSQRIREQFNRSAANAGWPVLLRWRGLRKTTRLAVVTASEQDAIVATLREMLKRFGPS